MLRYTTKLRTGTVIVRVFLSILSILLFLTGMLGAIGMIGTKTPDTGAMVFVVVIITLSYFIFRISAWNIRKYLIYDDRLDVKILWGVKTITYPKDSLKAFNDLKVLVLNESGGIGLILTNGKMIKILELEISEFPEFIQNLQSLVKWDLDLRFKEIGGFVQ